MKGVKGSRRKEFSKCCTKCGVEWLSDMSNKNPKRALCLKCTKEWQTEYNEKHRMNKYKMQGSNRTEKYKKFKMDVRKPYWKEVNDKLKGMKKREEWLPFIKEQMIGILNNVELMDYINDTNIHKD